MNQGLDPSDSPHPCGFGLGSFFGYYGGFSIPEFKALLDILPCSNFSGKKITFVILTLFSEISFYQQYKGIR